MNELDDAYVNAMLMVNMHANTRSVTLMVSFSQTTQRAAVQLLGATFHAAILTSRQEVSSRQLLCGKFFFQTNRQKW